MRLIDADAFKAEGRELYRVAGWDLREVHYSQLDTECNIDMMPIIEAEPVKHGQWKPYPIADDCWQCSVCGILRMSSQLNYCPSCGAKMDEVEK